MSTEVLIEGLGEGLKALLLNSQRAYPHLLERMIPPMRHAIVRAAVIGGSAVRLHASHARLQPATARSIFMGRIASIGGTTMHLKATAVPGPVQPGRGHVAALALVSFQPMCRRMKSTLASPVSGSETASSKAGAPGGAHAAGGVERIEQVEQEEEAKTGSERAIGWWLVGCSFIVVCILHIGGLTRLTGSGLSMVKWRPHGSMIPTTIEEWESEFEEFKKFPEYQMKRKYENFGLEEFKFIYFMEWAHRMAGRCVGVAFVVPLVYFGARGKIPKSVKGRLGFLLALGSTQGLVGWWMVRSGLTEHSKLDVDNAEEWQYNTQFAAVSPYRLAFHLSTAITLQLVLLTTGLALLDRGRLVAHGAATKAKLTWLWRYAHTAASFGGLAAFSGGFVAGNRAGLCCNDWPFMDGQVIPDGIWKDVLGWKNFFENQITVQFDHRLLAYSMLTFTGLTWNQARQLPLPPRVKIALNAVLLCCAGQVSLGICTLWFHVPIEIAAPHQVGSVITLSAFVWLLHTIRMVVPGARFIPIPPVK